MPKNLPIQYVETRGEQDIFLKEGGGDNKLPKWATLDAITRNVETLRNSISKLEEIFNEREGDAESFLPLITVAELHEKATAKSYRANVREVFDERKKRNVIGVTTPTELLVKIDNKDALRRLSRFYQEDSIDSLGIIKKIGVAAIVNLSLFNPEIEDDLLGHSLKVRLVDYKDYQLNERAERLFMNKCHELKLNAKKVGYANDLHLYSIEGSNDEGAIHSLTTMDGIISVKKMPYIEFSVSPEPYNTTIEVKSPREGEQYPLVGLLDSGVANIPHLSQWLQCDDIIADFDEHDINRRHGTAVAGVLNYGDELEQAGWTGCSPMKITSCIVNSDPNLVKVDEAEMIEYIKSAISTHPEVKVWNLSQGSTLSVKDDGFSEFAIALDGIQKDNNVLICKSAGNIDFRHLDDDRITQGADSVLSLVVGSIAHKCEREGDVEVGSRSSFSRKGPGPESLVKPDLVHYGGNTITKIHSFSETGYESNAFCGTSFSTPRVSALAANLAQRVNKMFDPTLIKALLIHNASYQNAEDIGNKSLLYEQGFGIPSSLNDILNNNSDEFTMIWQPPFDVGDAQIQDIPFPSSMIGDDGLFYGDITVTVVSNPVLKPSEGTEYCQSDVEVLLQTYDDIMYVPLDATGTPKRYRNANRLHNPQNILVKSLYGKKSLKASDMEERTLIESDFKYQPVKKYHVNLEKMTTANRLKYLKSDKRWGLSVKALYRDAVAADHDYDGEHEITYATIIITIKDPKHKGLAYDECYASLGLHNFNHSNIELDQRVGILNG